MDDGCRAIRGTMTSTEESDRRRILALNVENQVLDDLAGGEKLLRGLERNVDRNFEENIEQNLGRNFERNPVRTLELGQSYATCTKTLLDWSKRKRS